MRFYKISIFVTGTKLMDPLSLDPDVRVTPSHNDVIDALNGAFLSDIPDLSTIAVTEIGVIPPPPMFSSPSPPPPPLPPTTMANNSHQVLIIDMYSQFLSVVPLGGLVQGTPSSVPLRLRLVSLIYSLKVPLY